MAAVEGRLRVLAYPGVVAALAVLVVNDHALKAWSAGEGVVARTVTGKASDVAGVLLVAVLAGALSGRRRAALVAVGLAFAALKLSPAVAEAVAPLLGGGATRTDPWDLLGLVGLVPAWWALSHRSRDEAPTGGRRPVPRAIGLAVLVAAVPAITATSPRPEPCVTPQVVTFLVATEDGFLAAVGGPGLIGGYLYDLEQIEEANDTRPASDPRNPVAEVPALSWYRSADGASWDEAPEPAGVELILGLDQSAKGCTDALCVQADGGSSVSERPRSGGVETEALIPDVARSTGPVCSFGDEVVATSDEIALVTDRDAGLLRRTDADATWERVPVGPVDPAPERYTLPEREDDDADAEIDGPADLVGAAARGDLGDPGRATLFLLVAAVALLGAGVVRPRRGLGTGAAIVGAGLLGYWVALAFSALSSDGPSVAARPLTAAWVVATLGVAALSIWRRRLAPPPAAAPSSPTWEPPWPRTGPGPHSSPPPAPDPGDPSAWARPADGAPERD